MKTNKKDLPYSKTQVDTHHKAVKNIAVEVNRSFEFVESMLNSIFGKWGLMYYIERKRKILIRNFGTFYFHHKTLQAYQRRQQQIKEYDVIKKRTYEYRKKYRNRSQLKSNKDHHPTNK